MYRENLVEHVLSSENGGLLRPCLSSQNFLFLLRMSVIFIFPSLILRNLLLISSAHELEIGKHNRNGE